MQVSPVGAEPQYDFPSRQPIANISIAEIILCVLLVFSFWASYVWPLLIVVLLTTASIISLSHYRAASDAKFNQCCCGAATAPRGLIILSAVIIALTLLAIATGVLAAINYDGVTSGFAIASCIVLFGILITSSLKIYYLCRIQGEYAQWEAARRTAISSTMFPQTTIVSGQPIVTMPMAPMSPQPVFQVYDPNALPYPVNPQYVGPASPPHVQQNELYPPYATNTQPYGYTQPYGSQPVQGYGYSN